VSASFQMSRAPRRHDRTDCWARRLHLEVSWFTLLRRCKWGDRSGRRVPDSSRPKVSAPFVFRVSRFCAALRALSNDVPHSVLVEVHRVSMRNFRRHSTWVIRSFIGPNKIALNHLELVELGGAADTTALRIKVVDALIAPLADAANPIVRIVRRYRISVPTPSAGAPIPDVRVGKPTGNPSLHCDP
jgi:hypothetical protein